MSIGLEKFFEGLLTLDSEYWGQSSGGELKDGKFSLSIPVPQIVRLTHVHDTGGWIHLIH